jgi:uncharacterized membrane protein YidH (DUF202 family)
VAEPQARFGGNTTTFFAVTTLAAYISAGAHSFGLHSMTFWARLIIYAGTVLLYVGTAAWIVRAWTRRRYRDKSPSDLHYIAAGIVLVVSAGLGVLVASQIVVVLGYTG